MAEYCQGVDTVDTPFNDRNHFCFQLVRDRLIAEDVWNEPAIGKLQVQLRHVHQLSVFVARNDIHWK